MNALLTSSATAELLGVTRSTVVDYATQGKLIGSQLGGRWRFRPEDVEQFIRDLRSGKGK
jgi:excisionase family DNA binding protein